MHRFSHLITLSIALSVAACATGIDQDASGGGGTEADSDSGSSGGSAGDSGWHATDAGHTGDGSSLGTDAATLGDAGTLLHDSSVSTFDSAPPPPPPPSNACGVCDRDWVCNGFDDAWASVGGRCVNQANGTALRCNGILDGSSASNVGTWSGNASGFSMYFNNLGGGTVTIDCTP